MKNIIKSLGILVLITLVIFQITFVSTEGENSSLFEMSFINSASAEDSQKVKTQKETTDTQYKTVEGETKSRSRSKTDCEGNGTLLCTPSDWTPWSEWS